MEYKRIDDKQKKFLLKCHSKIEETIVGGATHVYQWELERELNFINKILCEMEYDIYYDSDRLNSLGNLYGYIKERVYTSN